jgi:hypothetical protein
MFYNCSNALASNINFRTRIQTAVALSFSAFGEIPLIKSKCWMKKCGTRLQFRQQTNCKRIPKN